MKIEFNAVYQPGTSIVRCGGDDGCGAHLNTGDMELHQKFHERMLNPWLPRAKVRKPATPAPTKPDLGILEHD